MLTVNQNNLSECGGGVSQRSALSLANSSAPSFPRKRESSKNLSREADELGFVPLRGGYPTDWIPAFAGMTRFGTHELFGLNAARQCAKQRGITLVELIIFIVIISVALTGILLVMNVVTRSSADPLVHKQALAIAESLLEEVELKPFTFCDPDDGSAETAVAPAGCGAVAPIVGAEVIGVENDVSRTDAVLPFDNVSDYNGFNMASGSVLDIEGGAAVAGYATAITVEENSFDGAIAATESLLITVTVTGPDAVPVVLQGYRMRYAPRAVP